MLYKRSELKCILYENTVHVFLIWTTLQMGMDNNFRKKQGVSKGGFYPPYATDPMLIMYGVPLKFEREYD